MRPPSHFTRALEAIDPLLRVRWGDLLNRWVIERKGFFTQGEINFLSRRFDRVRRFAFRADSIEKARRLWSMSNEIGEELASAKSGYRVIFFTDALDRRVFEHLCLSDLARYGGFSRYMEEREEEERQEKLRRERKDREEAADLHKETYDVLNWMLTKRQTELLHGKGRQLVREAFGRN